MHYRTSNEVGNAVGKQVGEYVLQNYLQPVGHDPEKAQETAGFPATATTAGG